MLQERAACEKELEGFPDDVSRRSTQVRLHSDANALRARIQSLEAEVSRWEVGRFLFNRCVASVACHQRPCFRPLLQAQ